jgi:hypothetical protein
MVLTAGTETMDELKALLSAIPDAAASPYAFLAYAIATAAWVFVAINVTKVKDLSSKTENLPEPDRLPFLETVLNRARPPGLTAQQWLGNERTKYIFWAAVVLILCLTAVVALAYTSEPVTPTKPDKLSRVHSAEIQVSSVDDFMKVAVNGHIVEDAKFEDVPPWRNILPNLTVGTNQIQVTITNGQYGGCGGVLTFKFNGKIIEALTKKWEKTNNQPPNVICFLEKIGMDFD